MKCQRARPIMTQASIAISAASRDACCAAAWACRARGLSSFMTRSSGDGVRRSGSRSCVGGRRSAPSRAAMSRTICVELVLGDLRGPGRRAPSGGARARRSSSPLSRPPAARRRPPVAYGGTTPPFSLAMRCAAPAVDALALLPVREHRRGDEDRRVGARERADEQREREVLAACRRRRAAAPGSAAACRTTSPASGQHLAHRAVDDLRERGPRHARHVLADAVEHDDRVVEREAQDGQQRRDRRRRHLPAGEGVDARRDQQVVHQRDEHRDRVLPLEAQRDVGADDDQRRDDRDDRRLGDGLAERRADRLRLVGLGGRRTRWSSARLTPRDLVGRSRRSEIWKPLAPSSLSSVTRWISASSKPAPLRARRGPGPRRRSATSAALIRVPDSKSMPKFRPLPPIASAPISRITPENEKNHFDAPMKSKRQRRFASPAPSADGLRDQARAAHRAEDRLRGEHRGEQRDRSCRCRA